MRTVCMVGVFLHYIAHTYAMKVLPLGEEAYIISDLGQADPFALAQSTASFPGVVESVSSYGTVATYVNVNSFILNDFLRFIDQWQNLPSAPYGKLVEIPACYELGLDFTDLCERLELEPLQLIKLHSGTTYRCYAVGFSPGFPYLGYLPVELQGLARLSTPRLRVPSGSIGITGNQSGIYPQETPGGWHLIARTPLVIANLKKAYFPISAGDSVQFTPIDKDEFYRLEGQLL